MNWCRRFFQTFRPFGVLININIERLMIFNRNGKRQTPRPKAPKLLSTGAVQPAPRRIEINLADGPRRPRPSDVVSPLGINGPDRADWRKVLNDPRNKW